KLCEEPLLLLAQVCGEEDVRGGEQVPTGAVALAAGREPLAPQPEDLSVLGALRDRERDAAGGRLQDCLAAEQGRVERDVDGGTEVLAGRVERLVVLDIDDEVDVAIRAAIAASTALPGDTDAGPGVDTLGNLDFERLVLRDLAGAVT